MTAPATTAVAVGLLAALAGCSSGTTGSATSTPPTDPAVSAITSMWVPVRDIETGIRFGMPTQPEKTRTTEPSDVERRQYKTVLDHVDVSVTIDSGIGKPVKFGDPATLARDLAASSRAHGNTKVQIAGLTLP